MQNLDIQNNLISGRGFDPRRLQSLNGLIAGLRELSKSGNWLCLINVSAGYDLIKGQLFLAINKPLSFMVW